MNQKRILIFCLFFHRCLLSATILIDPGHGGDDVGARGYFQHKEILEKDVNTTYALQLQKILKAHQHKVFLTRASSARTLPLGDRAKMAETIDADLFISIHSNWSKNSHSHGVEIYYPNNLTNRAIKQLESLENNEKVGENVGGTLDQILIDLIVQRTSVPSKSLSESICSELKKNHHPKIKIRSISPGLFYVLLLSKRPAILVELGFLSNQEELKQLTSLNYQEKFVANLAEGIEKYLKKSVAKSN